MSIRYEYKWAIVKDGKVVGTWYSRKEAKGRAERMGATCKRILVEEVNPLAVAAMAGQ